MVDYALNTFISEETLNEILADSPGECEVTQDLMICKKTDVQMITVDYTVHPFVLKSIIGQLEFECKLENEDWTVAGILMCGSCHIRNVLIGVKY